MRRAWVLSTYPQLTGLSYSPLMRTCVCRLVGLQERHPGRRNGGKGLEVGAQCGRPRNRGGPLAGAQGSGAVGGEMRAEGSEDWIGDPPWLCSGQGEWEAMGVGRRDMI